MPGPGKDQASSRVYSLACPAETRSNGVNEINNNKWLGYCYNNWGAGGVQQESMPDKKSLIIIGLG